MVRDLHGFPPTAFLIGAQKAGTTSLAFLLGQSPLITLSTEKEPHFFSTSWDRGLDWYRRCFADEPGTVLLDASTTYSMCPWIDGPPPGKTRPDWAGQVPKRIHELRPDARFLYVVRDPAERTYSAYLHRLRAGRESRPFRVAVEEEAGHYIDTSRYARQVDLYLEYFPLSSFLFIDFRDLTAHPDEVAARAASFLLGRDAGVEFKPGRPRNQAASYNRAGHLLRTVLGGESGMKRLASAVRTVTPDWSHPFIAGAVAGRPDALSEGDRAWLDARFGVDNERLAELTGIRFPAPRPSAAAA